MKTDSAGRVYSSCTNGVKVYSTQGRLLGEILVPGTANFCFGGAEDNRLFMLNDTAIWAVTLNARGNGTSLASLSPGRLAHSNRRAVRSPG